LLVVARRRRHDREIAGLILGGAAGLGFAALESTGYAFTAFLQSVLQHEGALGPAVEITLLRGALSPVGHGTWTALLASVLFREGMAARFRLNRYVVGAFLLVVVLHGLWDGLPGGLEFMLPLGIGLPAGQTIVAIVSLVLLRRRWVEAVRTEEAAGRVPLAAAAT
jgi:RsiW-degrading membrane proteinase PrsW (M82 family)